MKKHFVTLSLFFGVVVGSYSQELPPGLNKQGTFEILSRTDYNFTGCSFAKTDMAANMQQITGLINIMRKNQVLAENKGFMGRARIRSVDCKDDGHYGVPAEVSFEFCDFFKNKDGKEVYSTIEPPCWKMITNRLVPIGYMFSSDRFSRKPDFFTVPDKKETVEPGIDVYDGECYVVYDPKRPDYWLPVTVKEAFDVVFAENKKISDQIQRNMMLEYLNAEWGAIPKEDWDKPATLSGMISRVGTKEDFPQIMKVNPEYWDKNRPISDIQVIYFRMIGNQAYLKQRVEESKKYNSIGSGICRFEASLDADLIRLLKPLIIK